MPAPEPAITVADLGERAVVARIHARVPPPPAGVTVGIGDDAAVVEPDRGALTVVTTDTLVEGVHFDPILGSTADAGHKALAVNLSDLAAMGARPRYALLALSLPASCPIADVDALVDALVALAARHRTALIGGDVTASPGPLVVGVTAVGSVGRRRVLRRDAARPGDIVYVSGALGAAAAGLAALRTRTEAPGPARGDPGDPPEAASGRSAGPAPDARPGSGLEGCVERHRRPEPRVSLGVALGRNRAARACIDLSDGLGDAVHRIAAGSHAGVELDAEALPIDPAASAWFAATGLDPVLAALDGGEDYELAFTSPPRFRGRLRHVRQQIRGLAMTPVGVVTKDPGVRLRRGGKDEPLPRGYEHFSPRK
ncbi:MAG: thiamine-phosphate kinase [Acidobacteria bacterium]|nr:thiamine-phosphate kinase [Acidobacteriota bacterium]